MRLTGEDEATVIPRAAARSGTPSGGETRRFTRAQNEARNRSLEGNAVLAEEAVMPFHKALSRLEHAEALVLVHRGRCDHRLVSDDALSQNLGVFADGIVNEPPPGEELRRLLPNVLD